MEILNLIIAFLIGGFSGIILFGLTLKLVSKKTDSTSQSNDNEISGILSEVKSYISKKNRIARIVFASINGLGWVIIVFLSGLSFRSLAIAIIFSITLMISTSDIKIRKIPNELVLLTFVVTMIYIVFGFSKQSLVMNFIGFLAGTFLFSIPFILKSEIGGGDIKLIAVMGLCLGYPGILGAVMVLGGSVLIWFIYLLISKKGGLKTSFAMGPFISLGFITTLLLQR